MTTALAEKTCTPRRGGIPPLTPAEAEGYRSQAPAWALVDGAARIERTYL
jgi:4a-hydroxytetrahydrobiopterin dehydratase